VKFVATALAGAFLVELEPVHDERGSFARSWDAEEFRRHGLNPQLAQCSLSWNRSAGTLRGMHYQAPPHAEAKLVRCTRGAIYDVLLDLRDDSPTRCRWVSVELSAESPRMVYIPEGFAHGFQTLRDDCEVTYQISVPFHPESSRGVRWDDPAFGIRWPDAPKRILSQRDRGYPDFRP
jgi:dTDP-4-dehydrorhamnose 3,5-epimerase